MAIDLEQLTEVAHRPGTDEVVTRRWLRQVLVELREARGLVPAPLPTPAALDFDGYAFRRDSR